MTGKKKYSEGGMRVWGDEKEKRWYSEGGIIVKCQSRSNCRRQIMAMAQSTFLMTCV